MAVLTDGDIRLTVPGPAATQLSGPMSAADLLAYAKTVTQNPGSLLTPFEQYAASLLVEAQKLLARQRSQRLFTNAISATSPFTLASGFPEKVRMIGEVWGYGEFNLQNGGSSINLPADGNLAPRQVAQMTNSDMLPISLARLVSARGGAMAMGHIDSTGAVYLDAMTVGTSIPANGIISLVGMWPLKQWFDSQH